MTTLVVALIAAVAVAIGVVISVRDKPRRGRGPVSLWDTQRARALDETVAAHAAAVRLLDQWQRSSGGDIDGDCLEEIGRLVELSLQLRTVAREAPAPSDAVVVERVASAVDDLRIALAATVPLPSMNGQVPGEASVVNIRRALQACRSVLDAVKVAVGPAGLEG